MSSAQYSNWNDVTQQYGQGVSQILQQNNVPLSQVGSVIGSIPSSLYTNPSQAITTGGGGYSQPTVNQGGLAQALYSKYAGGGGQAPPNTGGIQLTGAQNPLYASSLLGAQALSAVGLNPSNTMTVNPTPANVPSSSQFAQSGVSQVGQPTTYSIGPRSGVAQPGQPGYPNLAMGSVFNPYAAGAATRPTVTGPSTPVPATQPYGQQATAPRAFASPPAVQTPQIPASPPIPNAPVAGLPPAAPGGQPDTSAMGGRNAAVYGAIAANPGAVDHPYVKSPTIGALPAGYAAGANAPPVNQQIPRFQDGGIVMDPTVAMVGDEGPEAIVPLDTIDPITGSSPITQAAVMSQQPYSSISGYGPGYPPPAPTQAAQPPQAVQPPPQQAQPPPQQTQPQQIANANPQQVGPPNPTPAQLAAANQQNQVGPPNPNNPNNPVTQMAQAAAHKGIMQVLGPKLSALNQQAGQVGQSLQAYGQGQQRQKISSAIPQPPAAPGPTQLTQLQGQPQSQQQVAQNAPMINPQTQQWLAMMNQFT